MEIGTVTPSPEITVAAFVASYYAACGRIVVFAATPGEPPSVDVYETDPVDGENPAFGFVCRATETNPHVHVRPGVDIFAVDTDDGSETWHAHVPAGDFTPRYDYETVANAVENGVAFD